MEPGETMPVLVSETSEEVNVGDEFLSLRGGPDKAEVGKFRIDVLDGREGIATLLSVVTEEDIHA